MKERTMCTLDSVSRCYFACSLNQSSTLTIALKQCYSCEWSRQRCRKSSCAICSTPCPTRCSSARSPARTTLPKASTVIAKWTNSTAAISSQWTNTVANIDKTAPGASSRTQAAAVVAIHRARWSAKSTRIVTCWTLIRAFTTEWKLIGRAPWVWVTFSIATPSIIMTKEVVVQRVSSSWSVRRINMRSRRTSRRLCR